MHAFWPLDRPPRIADADAMVRLFDTAEMDLRTPLVERRRKGRVHTYRTSDLWRTSDATRQAGAWR